MNLVPRELPPEARPMFRRHGAFALLDAATAAILHNTPVMALLALGAEDWKLSFQLAISSVGMFVALLLGGMMARRRKKPFLLIPGLLMVLSIYAMSFVGVPTVFLILLGLASLFEVALRPALTAIIRVNYPASHRGLATGRIRAASSVVFMTVGLGSSLLMAWTGPGKDALWMIQAQLLLAGTLLLLGLGIISRLQVHENPDEDHSLKEEHPTLKGAASAAMEGLRHARFRRYLGIALIYSFGALLYVSFIPVLLKDDLHLSYVGITLLTHVLPSLLALLSTTALGRLADRANPWKAWAVIRLGWGLDPLLMALASLATAFAPLALLLTVAGRICRGLVMGGSWILWWQVGLNHFAPPGADTTRYMGLLMVVNGISRLFAPLLGAWILQTGGGSAVLSAGALLVLGSSLLSLREFYRERRQKRLKTIESYEHSFSP